MGQWRQRLLKRAPRWVGLSSTIQYHHRLLTASEKP